MQLVREQNNEQNMYQVSKIPANSKRKSLQIHMQFNFGLHHTSHKSKIKILAKHNSKLPPPFIRLASISSKSEILRHINHITSCLLNLSLIHNNSCDGIITYMMVWVSVFLFNGRLVRCAFHEPQESTDGDFRAFAHFSVLSLRPTNQPNTKNASNQNPTFNIQPLLLPKRNVAFV